MKIKDVLEVLEDNDKIVVNCYANYIEPVGLGHLLVIHKTNNLTEEQLNIDVKRIYSYDNLLNIDI